MNEKTQNRISEWSFAIVVIAFFVGVVWLFMWGIPKYRVWETEIGIESAQNIGKAEMVRAEENRKIAIEEAKANLEVQKLNSKAEVERAKGMAQAIEIENGKLTTLYIQYLWVRNIDKMDGDKIYIPTESNLPLLEARQKQNRTTW